LAPDWSLIGGLLLALFGVVAGLIGGLYYFRRKSWVGKHAAGAGYKDKARNFNPAKLHTKGTVLHCQICWTMPQRLHLVHIIPI
jgi:hypothetical protein